MRCTADAQIREWRDFGRQADPHVCGWADQPDMVRQVLTAYRQGRSVRQIARSYPYARGTVTRILDAHGIERRTRSEQCVRVPVDLAEIERRHRLDGEPLSRLAAECGLSRQALSRRLERHRTGDGLSPRAVAA
jgi:hypothetical protein